VERILELASGDEPEDVRAVVEEWDLELAADRRDRFHRLGEEEEALPENDELRPHLLDQLDRALRVRVVAVFRHRKK
jgi:hypothetical protein